MATRSPMGSCFLPRLKPRKRATYRLGVGGGRLKGRELSIAAAPPAAATAADCSIGRRGKVSMEYGNVASRLGFSCPERMGEVKENRMGTAPSDRARMRNDLRALAKLAAPAATAFT